MKSNPKPTETLHVSAVEGRPSRILPCAENDHTDDIPHSDKGYRITINLRDVIRLWGAMVDRGANGCIIGKDMSVIERIDLTIDLSGLDDHTVRSNNASDISWMVNLAWDSVQLGFWNIRMTHNRTVEA